MGSNKPYKIYKVGGGKISVGDKLKVVLLDGFKLDYIDEFKGFKINILGEGVKDLVRLNGRLVDRIILFIEIISNNVM
ncbi:hypothetical protein CYK95_12640 [Clostridium perfringens]|nr:hypothetical protein CYK95_12640 [Clostridium perfringens]